MTIRKQFVNEWRQNGKKYENFLKILSDAPEMTKISNL